MAVSSDHRLLGAIDENGRVQTVLLEMATCGGSVQLDKPTGRHPIGLIAFHPARPWLAVADGGAVRVFRCEPLEYARLAATGQLPTVRVTKQAFQKSARPNHASAVQADSVETEATSPATRQVFFSYSRKDRKVLDELLRMLEPLTRSGDVIPWDDSKILTGRWDQQIEAAMRNSAVAVFLVSDEFMSSKFIDSSELPTLLGLARNGGIKITWLMLSPAIVDTSGLPAFQCFRDSRGLHGPDRPLSALRRTERKQVMQEFCQFLRHLTQQ